jgi:hypothetical protein
VISRPLSSANRPPRSYISGGYLVRLGIEERLLSTGSSPALNDSASRVRLTAGPGQATVSRRDSGSAYISVAHALACHAPGAKHLRQDDPTPTAMRVRGPP